MARRYVANAGVGAIPSKAQATTKTSSTQGRKVFFLDVRKGSLIHCVSQGCSGTGAI
ncbi:MAG TPA: hypothetical protein GXX40_08245 [Firmicutes bacterium]|nr:hypothetical protein [Bacillota bacterium]